MTTFRDPNCLVLGSSSGHQEDLPDPSLLRSKRLFRRHAVDHVDRAISKVHPR